MSEVLRTPEERFRNLPGFSFDPNYLEDIEGYQGLRLHYIDEGPRNAENIFLCLHGEPTWSYLYRKMIPVFTGRGNRVIAPDFFGFGRSDKPVDEAVYQFDFHRDMLKRFIETMDLRGITLVCQDWGGILGLTLPMAMPKRFSRLLIMNTLLATGNIHLSEGFNAWRAWVGQNPDMACGRLLHRACPHLSSEEIAAYDAPFPDVRYKAGLRRFPQLVPDSLDDPGAELSRTAGTWLRKEWEGPAFMAIGMKDPIFGSPLMNSIREQIPGCSIPFEVTEAGHFVQEWGKEVAEKALDYFYEKEKM